MIKYISRIGLVILGLLFALLVFGQDCTSCPPGSEVTLTSTYSGTYTHQWTCTNGFTSTSQSPTFEPEADVTCTLVVTDPIGCSIIDTIVVDVCECDCNENSCISAVYNPSTDCVDFDNTQEPCSDVNTDSRQYRNISTGSWTNIPVDNEICDCDIKEYINTTPSVTYNSGSFRLTVSGLSNYCDACSGSDLRMVYVFPITGYNSTVFPGCGAGSDWYSITPANFIAAGYVATCYVRYLTDWGEVVNTYRFTYDGSGTSPSDVAITVVAERDIYKTIETRRIITYTDGCDPDTCFNELIIPQQPPDSCLHFVAYINTVNLGSPCSGAGLSASTINGTPTINYQWTYNGSDISGQTASTLCMVGRPNGTYCVEISDANGCYAEPCIIQQTSCSLVVNITLAGTTLTANLQGCAGGSPTYQWARWNGTSWVNVGTDNPTYDTGGFGADYRCTVSCAGPCTAIGLYTYVAPCTATVGITVGSSDLTATVSGCGGATIAYTWSRWTGTAWTVVQTASTTSTTNVYTPSISGLYRVQISCNSCPAQAQATWTAPNPCTGFSVAMTGNNGPLCNGTLYTYGRNITGGSSPFTQQWTLNGSNVGTGTTYDFTPGSSGTYTIQIVVTDNNGCTAAAQKVVSSQTCCGVTTGISPSNPSVCTTQSVLFSASPSGGTGPYSYIWSSTSPAQSWGTSSTASINFATPGARTVQVQVTDSNGCSATNSTTMTVTTCEDCTCTPTLSLNSGTCILTLGSTGTGCSNYSYQLQYSASGSGWSVVASGTASNGWSTTHNPASNGLYRLVLFADDCTLKESSTVSVACASSCSCTPGTLSLSSCKLTWTNPCSGWVATLQYESGSYSDITQTQPYIPPSNGNYRVKYTKSGCTTVYSNVVNVTTPGCDAEVLYSDPTFGDLYCVDYTFPAMVPQEIVGNNNIRVYSGDCIFYGGDEWDYVIDWGDGSSDATGSGDDFVNHNFGTNGTYTTHYEKESKFGTMESDFHYYPDGTNPVPYMSVRPICFDGASPIYHAKEGCQAKLWFYFDVLGVDMSSVTYNTHQLKINGTNVPITRTVISGTPNVYWQFKTPDLTPIILSQSDLTAGVNTVELFVTYNTDKVLYLKGYFELCECGLL